MLSKKASKELCLALLHAEDESAIVELLQKAGLWDNQEAWRNYGDIPENLPVINQSADPYAAIAEKVTNAFDAVLFNEAQRKGIPIRGAKAPQTMAHALQLLVLDKPIEPNTAYIADIPEHIRREWEKKIAISVTGEKTSPSISIVDEGEGQTPDKMSKTLLSLLKGTRVRPPLAQGKHNTGGGGALLFSSPKHNFQLVISRRNPELLESESADAQDAEWGFTIVRREPPRHDERRSVFRYLAPVGADENPGRGSVLSFASPTLALMPERDKPYERGIKHGTLIKLFQYQMPARWDALQSDALIGRLENVLPEPTLPLRIHECRGYAQTGDSFSVSLRGVTRRMMDNSATWLENDFPLQFPVTVQGEKFNVSVYLAQEHAHRGRLPSGVFYTVNGQRHGFADNRFFTRGSASLGYLQKSLLMTVDCSHLSAEKLESLSTANRAQIRDNEFVRELTEALSKTIGENPLLARLNAERRNHVLRERSKDNQSLVEAVQDMIRVLPDLRVWLQPGLRISNPITPEIIEEKPYEGQYYPTFFIPTDKPKNGHGIERTVVRGKPVRFIFSTDAVNDYFMRPKDAGTFAMEFLVGSQRIPVEKLTGPVLQNGECFVSFDLPEKVRGNPSAVVRFTINDSSRHESIVHTATLNITDAQPKLDKPKSDEPKPDKPKKDRFDVPNPIFVSKDEWDSYNPPFTGTTALRIIQKPDGKGYDFYVNADNSYLLRYIEHTKIDPVAAKANFGTSLVLVGLALINKSKMA